MRKEGVQETEQFIIAEERRCSLEVEADVRVEDGEFGKRVRCAVRKTTLTVSTGGASLALATP